jgi:rSAM/selenodomain-associated transferase 1
MAGDLCILIMAKYPKYGTVKTRLSVAIGKKAATQLYTCLLKDTLSTAHSTKIPLIIYFEPAKEYSRIKELLGEEYIYAPQRGNEIGERLINGFQLASIMGFNAAIALASDLPGIQESILLKARDALDRYDSVIGPSPDGGYYLIGFRLNCIRREAFIDINWSTETVYDETMKKLMDISTFVLDPWPDIDTVDDLQNLRILENKRFANSSTYRFLENHLGLFDSG